VPDFPRAVTRLAAVGEATGALGTMVGRAGRLEEEAAVRRIEAAARLLGPVMIVLLGGLIGLMMGGLLSGVTDLGSAVME
jgi:general secretion pathway protein F